jgi:hypothetical protein
LSSPGDVAAERVRAEAVVRALQVELGERATLELIRWEDDYYTSTIDFQAQIALPSECDLVICVLWSRLGTELSPDRYRRPDGTSYDSGTEFEFENARSAATSQGAPDILTYRKTAEPRIHPDDAAALDQWRKVKGFWERWFQTNAGHFVAAFHGFIDTDDFADQFSRHLRAWLTDQGLFGGAMWPPEKGSPFRGLEAFEAIHASVFFGRRRAVRQVLAGLGQAAARGCAWLLVIGMSGSGKSSLLRAGLAPRLEMSGVTTPGVDGWRVCVTRADDGIAGLSAELFGALPALADGDHGDPAALADYLAEAGPRTLAAPLRAALARTGEQDAATAGFDRPRVLRLLLVVDQLESAFGLGAAERDRLVAVWDALARSGIVWVAAALRSDLYPAYQADNGMMILKRDGAHLDLLAPDAGAFGDIIRGPAVAAGLTYETNEARGETLADRLVSAAAQHPNALPLLQFTLDELYKRRRPPADGEAGAGTLTFAAYDDLGGLEGAIGQRAEATYQALAEPSHADAAAAASMPARPARLAQFEPASPERDLMDALAAPDARLLTLSGDADSARVRVAHEALLTHWARAAGHLEADRQDLTLRAHLEQDASRWAAATPDDQPALLLPPGLRLTEAEDLAARRAADLDADVRAYIQASTAAEEARQAAARAAERAQLDLERRRSRRLLRVAAAAVASALIAVGAGGYAYTQQQEAERQATIAAENEAEASRQAEIARASAAEAERQSEVAKAERARAEENAEEAARQRDAAEQSAAEATKQAEIAGAQRARAEGQTALAEQRFGEAEVARATAETARDEAEESFRIAVQAADALVFDIAQGLRRQEGMRLETLTAILGKAKGAIESLAAAAPNDTDLRRSQAAMLLEFALTYLDAGYLQQADVMARQSLEIARTLTALDPDNTQWHGDVSMSLTGVGDVLRRKGNTAGALAAIEESIKILRGLIDLDPDNTKWRRDVSVNLAMVGDMLSDQGDSAGALAAYEESLEIRRRLNTLDRDNTRWRRDVSVILNKIGDVLRGQSDSAGALAAYEESREIARGLAALDAGNTLWRRDVSVVLDDIGDVLLDQGNAAGALAAYEESLEIARGLAALDPGNNRWRRDVSVSLDKVGKVLLGQDDAAGALAAYEESLEIARGLAALDPGNNRWRRDVSISLDQVGDVLRGQGDAAGALAAYEESLEIRRGLAALDPGNTDWRRDVRVSLYGVGDMLSDQGDSAGALAAYEESLEIARSLAAMDPGNTQWLLEVAISLYVVSTVASDVDEKLTEALEILRALDHQGRLPEANRSWIAPLEQELSTLRAAQGDEPESQ